MKEKKRIYSANLAGQKIVYQFRNVLTDRYFGDYVHKSTDLVPQISVDDEIINYYRKYYPPETKSDYLEFRALIEITSRELLKYNSCIFHSVSFVFDNYAWLLSAPSGTGKTTQYINWKKLYPNDITMISGDAPILKMKHSKEIDVYPSPWNGKEHIGNMISAPLGGIIYLNQDNDNTFERLSPDIGVIKLMNQFLVKPLSEDEIAVLSNILTCLFKLYPIYQYNNNGTDQSTEMLRNRINELAKSK